jgi:hypothetical protein
MATAHPGDHEHVARVEAVALGHLRDDLAFVGVPARYEQEGEAGDNAAGNQQAQRPQHVGKVVAPPAATEGGALRHRLTR